MQAALHQMLSRCAVSETLTSLFGVPCVPRRGQGTWWHQSERAKGPLSERVNWGASRRHAAARPPWPMAAKRSPPSLKHTCVALNA